MAKKKYGSVVNRNGKLYARITWTDEKGKRKDVTRKATDKSDAQNIIAELLAKLNGSDEDHPSGNVFSKEKLTFEDLATYYENNYATPPVYAGEAKISGLRAYGDVRNHIRVLRDYFHRIKLSKIRYQTIKQFKLERLDKPLQRSGEKRSLANVHRSLSILRTMLNVAVQEEWISSNPFTKGKPLINMSLERPRERVLSREEENKLLLLCVGNSRAYLRTLIITALDTGMRRGEIMSLRWLDVNLAQNKIHIQAMNTKTLRPRSLPISGRLKLELQTLQSGNLTQKATDRIFHINGSGIPKILQRMCAELEINDLRFHDLRHTFATRLIQAGMPLAEVSKLLGHNTLSITYKHYVNADSTTIDRAIECLNLSNMASIGEKTTASIGDRWMM